MNLILDTNILILLARDQKRHLIDKINPDNQKLFISIVSIGELKSIALQNEWGRKKWDVINTLIDDAVIVDVSENLMETYSQIDSYSQKRNPTFSQYSFDTPRNMGKNDLWVASTSALLGLKLVTTDFDFNHLHKVFIELEIFEIN